MMGEGQWTPMPWINVIAGEKEFGFQVSESGAGYTWAINSGENRLTPWSNDAVSDPPGEIIYLRDEESGATWTPTPLPIRETSPYLIRHGQGYTVFEHASHGISGELLLFAPIDDPVARGAKQRRLSSSPKLTKLRERSSRAILTTTSSRIALRFLTRASASAT
jgi:cyclic beta-1,2-glucan synthetase